MTQTGNNRTKEEAMIIIARIVLSIALLLAGFAAGFPIGKSAGFTTGSEWALMQAGILARESGLSMPVSYEDGRFRVIIKQPRNLYKNAWHLADRHDEKMQGTDLLTRPLVETVQLAGNTTLIQ